MRRPWRSLAILLFSCTLLVAGLLGDELLALSDDARDHLKAYTELISVAHERYGDELTYKDLIYSSINGMLRSLDPHTSFLPREAYDSMREKQQSTFYGLGIYVGTRNGQLTVITPIPGTPASEKGMRAGDVISAIDGQPTDKMTQDEAIGHLKGPKGTSVMVTLTRPGLDEPLDLEITRAEIPQTTVQYTYMLDEETGYISIRDFSRSTGSEVARALEKLQGDGMQRLILDLRGNGGGLLDQAIEVADQFVPGQSKIVETRGRIESSFQSFSSSGHYEELARPLIVLVNSGSASASEILAGAIQDHDVGLVVGEATWGKGLVQTVYSLPWGNGIALTTARYYTPAGRLIQRDYTSYWDYYTNWGEEDEGGEEERGETFNTDLGREVYGGGGIDPDHEVELEAPDPYLGILLGRSAFFRFAVDLNSHGRIKDAAWRPSDEDMAAFRKWLTEQDDFGTAEEIDEAFAKQEFIDYARARLRYEVLNTSLGLEAGHRALVEVDDQIQRAIELFPEAASLLQKRQMLASSIDQSDR